MSKERYSVRIMRQNTNFSYEEAERYNNVKGSIIKWLIKNHFAFTLGLSKRVNYNVVDTDNPHHICVFLKPTHLIETKTMEKSLNNHALNKKLLDMLED